MEHISPPLVPILRQINTVHNFHSIFTIATIIIPSTTKLSNWPFPFKFSYQNFNALPPSPKLATCPTHITILTLIILILHTMQVSLDSCCFSSAPYTNVLSLYFPEQEILKLHTQNMNQAKLYFIPLHFHMVSCKQENQKTKMGLRVEGCIL